MINYLFTITFCFLFFREERKLFEKKFSFPHTPILQKLSKKGYWFIFYFVRLMVKSDKLLIHYYLLFFVFSWEKETF